MMKFNFLHVDKHQSLQQVASIILGECSLAFPKYPQKVFISLQYLHKIMGMKLIIYLQINIKVFYKMIVSLCVCIVKQVQSTQNNKFTMSLPYVKENTKNKVDFLPADKCRKFLQSDIIILGLCSQTCPYYPK